MDIYWPCHSFMEGLMKRSERVPPCTEWYFICIKAKEVNVSVA